MVGQDGVTSGLILTCSLLSIPQVIAAPIAIGEPGEFDPAPSVKEELLVL